ncbi:polysaccharide deacetylase family protein [Sediminibacillus massiliensis]|uniref:polysaccharide deacetylase family protein n=1 Tax=Sediminibacillus massiliensis TaxID=1926277 RepID=UPI001FEC2A6F|nr:polysaccharide deacetylase family protein [Sediminibacillus massiliensis]
MVRWVIHLLSFLIIVRLAMPFSINPFEYDYLEKTNPLSMEVASSNESLRSKIQAAASEFEIAPQNAKIDRVWKKMPGRNGLTINMEKSLEKMEQNGKFDKKLLVFDQKKPEITLKDLPPAPIYRGHPEKNMVSLLINVAWGTENIPPMLKVLKQHNVKANFFIEGKWASQNRDIVVMIQEEGHLIGNHAYNHPDMRRLSEQENREQIVQTNDILKAITGETPIWFAPPSGSYNDTVVRLASDLNMQTVLWSVDTIDWRKPTVDVMLNRVSEKLHPGAMILMHPTDVIRDGLDDLVKDIKGKNYKIGTVEKLLSEER